MKESYAVLADRLIPYLTKYFKAGSQSSGGSSSVQQHTLSGSLHTGILDDDQGPQFFKLDGSRPITGNITFAGAQTVDGVDISAHAASPSAHHAPVTVGVGLSLAGQQVSLSNTVAGAGLTYTSGVLAVGQGAGITVNADDIAVSVGAGIILSSGDVALGTPSSLSAITGNAVTSTSHTHVIATSNNPGANVSILASSGSGGLILVAMTATSTLATPVLTTTSGDITINPVGNVLFPNAQTVRSTTFSSGLTIQGWQINEVTSGTSALTIGTISVDELRAKVFVADEVRVDRGEQVWGKSFGIVETAFVTPSVIGNNGVEVWWENSPAIAGAIFTNGDWLRLRIFDNTSGFTISNIWGQVYSAAAGGINGYLMDSPNNRQRWRFVLRSGDTSYTIKKGNVAIDYGASGQPYIFLSAVDPAGAPYIKFNSWAGSDPFTAANHTTGVVIGNLKSVFGVTNEYGLGAGDGFTSADQWIRASSSGVTFNNVAATWRSGGTAFATISATNGIDLVMPSSTFTRQRGYTFITTGGVEIGGTYAYTASVPSRNEILTVADQDGTSNYATLYTAVNSSSYVALTKLAALGPGKQAFLQVTYSGGSSSLEGEADSVNVDASTVTFSDVNSITLTPPSGAHPIIVLKTSRIETSPWGGLERLLLRAPASGKVQIGNLTSASTHIDHLGIGVGADRDTLAGASRYISRVSGAVVTINHSAFGYGSSIAFNAAMQYQTSTMTSVGMMTYTGGNYANVTAPGMLYYDANGGFFAFYKGQQGLAEGDPITWSEKIRIDKFGNLSMNGQSAVGGEGVLAMKTCNNLPESAPTGGGIIFINGGALYYMGSSGTLTKVANP